MQLFIIHCIYISAITLFVHLQRGFGSEVSIHDHPYKTPSVLIKEPGLGHKVSNTLGYCQVLDATHK